MTTYAWVLINISLLVQGGLPVAQERLVGDREERHEREGVLAYVTTSSLAFVLLLVYVLVTGYSAPVSWSEIGWHLFGITIGYAVANVCFFEALRHISSSDFSLVFTWRVIIVVLLAGKMLNEGFAIGRIVGALLIMAGVAYVTIKRSQSAKREKEYKYLRGLSYAIVGTVSFGVANSLDAHIVETFDPPSYLLFRIALPLLLVMVVSLFWVKPRDVITYASVRSRRIPLLALIYYFRDYGLMQHRHRLIRQLRPDILNFARRNRLLKRVPCRQ